MGAGALSDITRGEHIGLQLANRSKSRVKSLFPASRIAVYGPVRTAMWQGRRANTVPTSTHAVLMNQISVRGWFITNTARGDPRNPVQEFSVDSYV